MGLRLRLEKGPGAGARGCGGRLWREVVEVVGGCGTKALTMEILITIHNIVGRDWVPFSLRRCV